MKSEKADIKKELKTLWDENKGKVKVGCSCLLVGAFYGFIKGVNTQGKLTGKAMCDLIDKIPTLPEPDDIPLEDILKGCSKKDIMEFMDIIGCKE